MCGINGIISKHSIDQTAMKAVIDNMNRAIFHRGPDDSGKFIFQADNFTIGLGMQRLSIIDLSTGNQPMFSDDDQLVIVFNGEIYNYRELKQPLLDAGVNFKTTSDTEVILKLYEQEGPAAFARLDGMFGLSIFDRRKNKVYLARDYFGEKPMYYSGQGDNFIWCSELKSMTPLFNGRPEISRTGLNLFFRLTYIPAPYTIYQGVHKLEPNHYLEYDLNNFEYNTHPIHPKLNTETRDELSLDEARQAIREKVYDSIVSRSVSDVPVGTFLSGGVDSSIVSYCLADHSDKKIDTFSIGFTKKRFDETDKSRVVAELIGSTHHEFIIDESDLAENIHEIVLNFDEPFGDASALPTYLVSNRTSDFLKVALTGDGGDEVFGGYNKYYIGKLNRRYKQVVPKSLHSSVQQLASPLLKSKEDRRGLRYRIQRALDAVNYEDDYYWNIISLGLTDPELQRSLLNGLYKPGLFDYYKKVSGIDSPSCLNEFQAIDLRMSLEGDMLTKVDRSSMLNSLECRAPFLNRELLEFNMQLPENYLLKGWNKKYLLKSAFEECFPEGFLDKSKQGFGAPVGDWLREGLKQELLGYIDENFLSEQNLFNIASITELVQNHIKGKADNAFKVWSFYCFQKWYKFNYLKLN